MLCMIDLKSIIQEENISRKSLRTPASKLHRRSFYLESNLLILLFRIKSSDPDHRLKNHGTTISCLGSAAVYFNLGPTAGRLSLINLWGFCSAFPITSSTVHSQRAQKYFPECSSFKDEMVSLMNLCAFWKFTK